MEPQSPKVFISYSWSNEPHKDWVLRLATDLRSQGVDISIDRWDLREGMDKFHYMETSITNAETQKILIICDKTYAEKSNTRSGGVGTEAGIISSELYNKVDQVKFAAVITQKDEAGKEYIPVMLRGRIYFDMSFEEEYYIKLEEILRWIFDKPVLVKPPIGKRPTFLDSQKVQSACASFRRSLDAVKTGSKSSNHYLGEYFEEFLSNCTSFQRIISSASTFDELTSGLDTTTLLRDEFIEILDVILSMNDSELFDGVERVFFDLSALMSRNCRTNSPGPYSDNFDFFVYELWLHSVSRILRKERFEEAESILTQRYAVSHSVGKKSLGFQIFRPYPKVIEHWNSQRSSKLLSPIGELIHQRSRSSRSRFDDIALVDLVLYFRDLFSAYYNGDRQYWYSYTLLYAEIENTQFPLTVRAESSRYIARMLKLFGAKSKDDFQAILSEFKEKQFYVPMFEFHEINVFAISNFKNWGTV